MCCIHSHGEVKAARSETFVTFRQKYYFKDIINLLDLTDFSMVDTRFLVDYDRTKSGRVQEYCEGSCIQHNSTPQLRCGPLTVGS